MFKFVKNFRISTKIILPIMVTAVLVLTFASVYSYNFNVTSLENATHEHLETAVQSRVHHIDSFLGKEKQKIEMIASSFIFKKLFDEDTSNYQENLETACARINKIVETDETVYELFVLNADGEVICSSAEENIGLDKSDDDYFMHGIDGTYIKDAYLSETTKKESLAFSAPITCETGGCLGVMVSRVETTALNEIVEDRAGLGETGEIYVINSEGYMITPSRQKEDTFLSEKVDTENAKNCLSMFEGLKQDELLDYETVDHGGHESVMISQNYLGVDGLGSHYPLHNMNWCVLAEIDKSEALSSSEELLKFSIIRILIVLLVFVIITYFLARLISGPILALIRGVKIVGEGDLNHKVGTDTTDEIGQLSRAFDEMTMSVKKSRAEIEQKVSEQTEQIVGQNDDLENKQKAILNVLEDVEEEKKISQREKKKIETIVNSIGDGVFVVDNDYKILLVNGVTEEISGYSRDEMVGKDYREHLNFRFEDNDKVNDKFVLSAISEGKVQEMANHTLLVSKDGKRTPVADSAAPLKDGKDVIGCVVVFRDVTHEREIEQMKTDFISVASHELRTPMTAIKGFLDMIINGDVGKVPNKEMAEYLDLAYEGNDRLIRLVNDMLNASRIEAGRMRFTLEDVNLDEMISRQMKDFETLAKDRKLKISYKGKKVSKVVVAKDKLMIVVNNLVGNAIKYTEKGSVTVSLSEKDEKIKISVVDTGPGIGKEDQDKLFKKFSQVDASIDRSSKGTGLGLYITKMIVDKLGGEIGLESEVGKGSTFYVTIPVKGSEASTKVAKAIELEATKITNQK